MQRALVFLGVVLAVVIIGWQDQRREASHLRAELSAATSALSGDLDPTDLDSIVYSERYMEIGPGGVHPLRVPCPARYRILYGRIDSVSSHSEILFSKSFGSPRSWWVGLDNSASKRAVGNVTAVAACEPAEDVTSRRAEHAAGRLVVEAIVERRAEVD